MFSCLNWTDIPTNQCPAITVSFNEGNLAYCISPKLGDFLNGSSDKGLTSCKMLVIPAECHWWGDDP